VIDRKAPGADRIQTLRSASRKRTVPASRTQGADRVRQSTEANLDKGQTELALATEVGSKAGVTDKVIDLLRHPAATGIGHTAIARLIMVAAEGIDHRRHLAVARTTICLCRGAPPETCQTCSC